MNDWYKVTFIVANHRFSSIKLSMEDATELRKTLASDGINGTVERA